MSNSVQDWDKELNSSNHPGYRQRSRVRISETGRFATYQTGTSPGWIYGSSGSSERVLDMNKPYWYAIRRMIKTHPHMEEALKHLDLGSPFVLERASISYPGNIYTKGKLVGNTYIINDGLFFPSVPYKLLMTNLYQGRPMSMPTDVGTDMVELWAMGSTAIKKSLPDIPDFSFYRFIGELRRDLPKIPLAQLRKSERKLSALGSEYLNVQFGILPTVSDVNKLIHLATHPELRRRTKRFLGQETRVRKTILKDSVSSSVDKSTDAGFTSTVSSFQSSQIRATQRTQYDEKIWSSVSFAWFQATQLDRLLVELEDQLGNFGSIPKLIDFWNLTGWTWLVDWFSNFNHVLTNLSYLGRDGLYLQHGYLMATHQRTVETIQTRLSMGQNIRSVGVEEYVRKYRVKASPFGFGLTFRDFDTFQTSILAALGISRLRF